MRKIGESIKSWRDRIINRNRYGTYGGELTPSVVTGEMPTDSKARIKALKERRKNSYDSDELDSWDRTSNDWRNIKNQSDLDYYTNQIDFIDDRLKIDNAIKYEKDRYNSDHFLGAKNGNDIRAQLYRWWSRHYGYKSKQSDPLLTGKGTDVISLDNDVLRVTPDTQQQTALFNEFVEMRNPSIRSAGEYQSGNIKTVGDGNIPFENINLWAGIEDGHFKVDSLKNFNANTQIFPARNIRRGIPMISRFNIEYKENKNPFGLNDSDKRALYSGLFFRHRWFPEEYNLDNIRQKIRNLSGEDGIKYSYTDVDGNEHPIGDYNASILDSKMVFGNPNGGRFIGRIQDISPAQLDSLNAYLSRNPSWLVRPDLGSFEQYRTDSPTAQEYMKQYIESIKASDPNVYIVGTK